MTKSPQEIRGSELAEFYDSNLVESATAYFLECGFDEDMANGFRSGIEAVLGITSRNETEDLSDKQLAEREEILTEIRQRVASKFSLRGEIDG